MDDFTKVGQRKAKITVLLLLGVDGITECVGNLSSIHFSERCLMTTATSNTSFDFIKRAAQHCCVGFVHAITAATHVNHEKTERKETQTVVRLCNSGFNRKDRRVSTNHFSCLLISIGMSSRLIGL